MTRPEFLKAVRALSARYVETRARLADRTPTDSPGKRAAFAGFYAPLHFLTARAVVNAVGAARSDLDRLVDLGCGTGVAAAAWAMACRTRPSLSGVDRHSWMLQEAMWTWRMLGLRGRVRRGDLVVAAERLADDRRARAGMGVVLGWSVNELEERHRQRLLPALCTLASRGVSILVIEPIARAAAPWWDEWVAATAALGGRAGEWKFDPVLPAELAALDEAAGFRRQALAARSLWVEVIS
jgi:hypothetical protein